MDPTQRLRSLRRLAWELGSVGGSLLAVIFLVAFTAHRSHELTVGSAPA